MFDFFKDMWTDLKDVPPPEPPKRYSPEELYELLKGITLSPVQNLNKSYYIMYNGICFDDWMNFQLWLMKENIKLMEELKNGKKTRTKKPRNKVHEG